ncbi:hypothetical protein RND81_05G225100 [Saponaria officinalis]|uniref:Ninja-family protein n=1 Tax=Saponaria officinalis TaxID=3572 RepID=A0AAW1L0X7_SAPOF
MDDKIEKLKTKIIRQKNIIQKNDDDVDDDDDLDLCLGLKRKAPRNGVVIEEEGGGLERRRKVVNWWGNVEGFRVRQGYNGHFASKKNDGENSRSPNSTGSSSGFSDSYHSNSYAGGHSSDTSSHSSQSRLHLPAVKQPDSASQDANQKNSNHNHNHNQFSKNVTSTDIKETEANAMARSPSPKDSKVVIGKPPKPKRQMSQQSVLLPQMPCVSATGNGPDGKTINGFLYKYSKTEVSIVCVCHGTSFSPAGFVEHAGGVDVEHPLRHIRVVPFALS